MTREAVDVGVVEPLVDLHGIFAGIRWRRGVWSTLAVVGLLLGVASALFLPQSATASARVYVVYPDAANSGESQEKTSVAVLMSSTVASAALQRLGSTERPEDFLNTYSAESQAANTLDITASGKNADDAVRNVQAITDAFITDHSATAPTTRPRRSSPRFESARPSSRTSLRAWTGSRQGRRRVPAPPGKARTMVTVRSSSPRSTALRARHRRTSSAIRRSQPVLGSWMRRIGRAAAS